MFGDRRQTTIEQSKEYMFAERMLTILGSERVAITITDIGDAAKAGAIVAFKTKA